MSDTQLINLAEKIGNAFIQAKTHKGDRHMTDIIISDKPAGLAPRVLMRRYDGPAFDWFKFDYALRLIAYTKDGFKAELSISLNQCYKLIVAKNYIEIEFPYYEKKLLQDLHFNATNTTHLALITSYHRFDKTDVALKREEMTEEADIRYIEEKHLKDVDADLDIYRLMFYLKHKTDDKQEVTEDEQTVSN